MKKILVLAAAFSLVATSAMALSVVNSKHNLSSIQYSGGGTIYATDVDEVCVFCHTPHAADVNTTNGPLWNRDLTSVAIADTYNSTTLSAASQPATVNGNIAATDVLLCMSCHDGGTLAGGLKNPSNASGQPTTFNSATAIPGASNTNIGAYDGTATARGSSDLRDDHPVAMVYADVNTAKDAAFVDTPTSDGSTSLLRGGLVWCSSCHNVHDNAEAPFLRMSNTASALCTACHIK